MESAAGSNSGSFQTMKALAQIAKAAEDWDSGLPEAPPNEAIDNSAPSSEELDQIHSEIWDLAHRLMQVVKIRGELLRNDIQDERTFLRAVTDGVTDLEKKVKDQAKTTGLARVLQQDVLDSIDNQMQEYLTQPQATTFVVNGVLQDSRPFNNPGFMATLRKVTFINVPNVTCAILGCKYIGHISITDSSLSSLGAIPMLALAVLILKGLPNLQRVVESGYVLPDRKIVDAKMFQTLQHLELENCGTGLMELDVKKYVAMKQLIVNSSNIACLNVVRLPVTCTVYAEQASLPGDIRDHIKAVEQKAVQGPIIKILKEKKKSTEGGMA